MLAYLTGTILETTATGAIILVGGLGYEVSGRWLATLPVGEHVTCYTYEYLENQSLRRLVACQDLASRNLLITLLSVPGVGPKLAGRILDTLGRTRLTQAITDSDLTVLGTVKGLGKKTAQKIILELGKKLVLEEGSKSSYYDALAGLGFTPREIDSALGKLNLEGMSENQVIATLLKHLGRAT